jgi:hypothetical protein
MNEIIQLPGCVGEEAGFRSLANFVELLLRPAVTDSMQVPYTMKRLSTNQTCRLLPFRESTVIVIGVCPCRLNMFVLRNQLFI